MYWHRNPDIDIRRQERDYQNSGSIYDAAQLMTSYFRAGEVTRGTQLLQIIEDQYAQLVIKDLGLEAVIVGPIWAWVEEVWIYAVEVMEP